MVQTNRGGPARAVRSSRRGAGSTRDHCEGVLTRRANRQPERELPPCAHQVVRAPGREPRGVPSEVVVAEHVHGEARRELDADGLEPGDDRGELVTRRPRDRRPTRNPEIAAAKIGSSNRTVPASSPLGLHHDRIASPSSNAIVPCPSVSRSTRHVPRSGSRANSRLEILRSPWQCRRGVTGSVGQRPRDRQDLASEVDALRVATRCVDVLREPREVRRGVVYARARERVVVAKIGDGAVEPADEHAARLGPLRRSARDARSRRRSRSARATRAPSCSSHARPSSVRIKPRRGQPASRRGVRSPPRCRG